jgi:hypothetical protein
MAQFARGPTSEPARRHNVIALPHCTYQWRKARMPDDSTPRSRRALLAAAAGGAAALAAQAALPLTAMAADPNDVVLGSPNTATTTTSITNSTDGGTAFAGSGTGTGYGVQATSEGGAGSFSWSIVAPDWWEPGFGAYTGAFGFAPTFPDPDIAATGVWGDSPDFGVYGTGSVGVYGYGGIGVIGSSTDPGFPGVKAYGNTSSSPALEVVGKVKFNRAGRKSIGAGKSSLAVTMAGVTTTSKILAVLNSNRSGRYVRAVVASTGKFTIYLNSSVSSSTYVAYFVFD